MKINALQTAVYRGNINLVNILIKRGARFNLREYKDSGIYKNRNYLLYLIFLFISFLFPSM